MEVASSKYASRLCCTTLLDYFTTILYYTRLQSAPMWTCRDSTSLFFPHFTTLLHHFTTPGCRACCVRRWTCRASCLCPLCCSRRSPRAPLHVREREREREREGERERESGLCCSRRAPARVCVCLSLSLSLSLSLTHTLTHTHTHPYIYTPLSLSLSVSLSPSLSLSLSLSRARCLYAHRSIRGAPGASS
jgi:hypothetical protein